MHVSYDCAMPRTKLRKFTELPQFELDPDSIQMLPLAFCSRNQVVVLGHVDLSTQEPIHLGMLEPRQDQLIHALAMRWARPVIPVQLNQYEVNKALDVGFGSGVVGDEGASHVLDLKSSPATADSEAVELVDDMLLHAIAQRASDIHLECYAGDVDLRLRIDGVMHQLLTHVDPENLNEVTNRIKVISGLDIVERRHPQDGRFRVIVKDGARRNTVDFRVNVLPGPFGEDVVVRVLDANVRMLGIDKLGMNDVDRSRFETLIGNPEGTILVTGPTGSGKTTTLYSALGTLNDGSRKVLTAEDPIEYYLPKVNQKQVGPRVEMAELARAFLRQDPDVILVGEIRDAATAEVVARAASTGHLVFSTLHTPDALGAIPRLKVLGLSDNQTSDTLLLVVSQRLARRVCRFCAEPVPVSDDQRRVLGCLAEGLEPKAGHGCERCRGTGGVGRTGLFELLVIDEELQNLISEGVPTPRLRQHLRDRGHLFLVDDALAKVRAGEISVDELLRVIPYRQIMASAA